MFFFFISIFFIASMINYNSLSVILCSILVFAAVSGVQAAVCTCPSDTVSPAIYQLCAKTLHDPANTNYLVYPDGECKNQKYRLCSDATCAAEKEPQCSALYVQLREKKNE